MRHFGYQTLPKNQLQKVGEIKTQHLTIMFFLKVKDFYQDAYQREELKGCTYHSWNGGSNCPRIDYIFYNNSENLQLINGKASSSSHRIIIP